MVIFHILVSNLESVGVLARTPLEASSDAKLFVKSYQPSENYYV
jgi:hypothetical protein